MVTSINTETGEHSRLLDRLLRHFERSSRQRYRRNLYGSRLFRIRRFAIAGRERALIIPRPLPSARRRFFDSHRRARAESARSHSRSPS